MLRWRRESCFTKRNGREDRAVGHCPKGLTVLLIHTGLEPGVRAATEITKPFSTVFWQPFDKRTSHDFNDLVGGQTLRNGFAFLLKFVTGLNPGVNERSAFAAKLEAVNLSDYRTRNSNSSILLFTRR